MPRLHEGINIRSVVRFSRHSIRREAHYKENSIERMSWLELALIVSGFSFRSIVHSTQSRPSCLTLRRQQNALENNMYLASPILFTEQGNVNRTALVSLRSKTPDSRRKVVDASLSHLAS